MKKMAKAMYGKSMMKGGASKMKKYKLGNAVNDGPGDGKTSAYQNAAKNPVNEKIAMDALGIKKPKPKPQSVFPNMNKPGAYDDVRSSKYGGTAKPKMMKGGAKPKAMYGTAMKPGMMKKGGAKKK